MNLPIPPAILYAGLAGVLLALIVATAQNKWQWRVFLLLALRLAIGWHFLFEGLHKVQSEYTGVTDTNRVFTSEPYFAVAEGPLGEELRKEYIGDPEKVYTDMLKQSEPMTADEFKKLTLEQQAERCHPDVAKDLREVAAANIDKAEADAETAKAAQTALPVGTTDAEKKTKKDAEAKAEAAEYQARLLRDEAKQLRAAYARWVYGVDRIEAKVGYVTGGEGALQFTAPERLRYLGLLQKELDEYTTRQKYNLGTGTGIEQARTKKAQTDLQTAKAELANDSIAFVKDLKKAAGIEVKDEPKEKPIRRIDWLTRWGITIIGAGLLMGLFTRLWCLAGAGFLVMTYLSHPTVPWLPLPPGTEGNPLFINKNLIEALALLALAAHPTGRWLGLDALVHRIVFPKVGDPV